MDKNAFKEAKGVEKGTKAVASPHGWLSYVFNWRPLQRMTETLPFNNNYEYLERACLEKCSPHYGVDMQDNACSR